MGEDSDQGQDNRVGPTGTIRDGVASVYHFLPGTLLLVTAFGGVFDDTNRFLSEVDMGDLVLYVGPYLPDLDWGLVCTSDGCFGRMYLKKGYVKEVAR